jgi:hypothetical protein
LKDVNWYALYDVDEIRRKPYRMNPNGDGDDEEFQV